MAIIIVVKLISAVPLKTLLFLVHITDTCISKYISNLTDLLQMSAIFFHDANKKVKHDLAVFFSFGYWPRDYKKK